MLRKKDETRLFTLEENGEIEHLERCDGVRHCVRTREHKKLIKEASKRVDLSKFCTFCATGRIFFKNEL